MKWTGRETNHSTPARAEVKTSVATLLLPLYDLMAWRGTNLDPYREGCKYVATENPRMVIRKNMKGRKPQIKFDGQTNIIITHKQIAKDNRDRDV